MKVKSFFKMTDKQRAIHFMNKAFALYERSERILTAQLDNTDWKERRVMWRDFAALQLEANNAAREAERLFKRS